MITLEVYGGFQSMVSIGSLSYLSWASIAEGVGSVAAPSAKLIERLTVERLSMLVGVSPCAVYQTPV